jgi:hypothetical protein
MSTEITTDNTAPETVPDNTTPEPTTPDAPDLATQVQTLMAQVSALTQAKTASDQAAEAARVASLSEAERVAEERKQIAGEREAMLSDARKTAAEKLGINPKAFRLLPEVDPRTPEGAKAFEQFARDNPEFVAKTVTPSGETYNAPPKSVLARILSGETTHPLFSAEHLRSMLTRN